MKRILALVVLTGTFALTSCNDPKIESEEQKYSYAIGFQFAQNLKGQNVEVDSKALALAVSDVLSGKDPKISEQEMQASMQKMYEKRRENMKAEADKNKKSGEDFLAKNKDKGDVKTLESGLQYQVITAGDGAKPGENDTVKVHYKGTLIDGTEFDSSYKRDKPAEFPVKAVIPGWTEALQLMKKGGKWKLWIPSELAYGERGRPSIPPNSVLIFEVELLDIMGDKK
ncbi:MAG: FKBP-type peptidyl-prolyl cis-trans isomerase [Bdellovibrionales bacterium]|nr:FKBP-type peptidyl-prolyl cis-trans isomerase [Bdellovibrionales bacterium]